MQIIVPPIQGYVAETKYVAPGDLLIRGAGESVRLGIGTARQILRVIGAGGALEYTDMQNMFHKCYVYSSIAQSIPSAVWTKLTWDLTVFDPDVLFDNANDRIKPTIPGYYLIAANVCLVMPATINNYGIRIQKTGTNIYEHMQRHYVAVAVYLDMPIGGVLSYFDGVNDYVELYVNHVAGVAVDTYPSILKNYLQILGPF